MKLIIDKFYNPKLIKIAITIMFLCLPLMDILRFTFLKDIEVLGISLVEIVNIVTITSAFVMTIPVIKKKHLRFFIFYFLLIFIYIIFHVINSYNFDLGLLPDSRHNFIVESFYIFRVYILPLMLMIVLFENKEQFNKRYYINIIKYFIIFISGSILVLNIFRFSYSSYPANYVDIIFNKTSFFDVFSYGDSYKKLLTVGLFSSANQISIILFMLLPITIYILYDKCNISNNILLLVHCISMIIVGTRTSAFGCLLVLICTLFLYIFFIICKRNVFNKNFILRYGITFVIIFGIFMISPFKRYYYEEYSRNTFKNDLPSEEIEKVSNLILDDLSSDDIKRVLLENPKVFKIDLMFYEMYPIDNDIDFWLTIARRDRFINNNYRVLKNDIMKRVIVRNNNKYDKYFGLGYTIGVMDMERDYVYQYYLFGIIGVILLIGVYVLLYIYNALKLFMKSYFNYEFCLSLVAPFLGLVGCYLSGHLFGWVSPMIILAMLLCFERVNE